MKLPQHLKPLLPQLLRFGLVGALATATHASIYHYAVSHTAIPPLTANPAAFAVAFFISFIGHRYWTFTDQAAERALPKFFATALLGFGSNQFFTWLVVSVLQRPPLEALWGIVLVTPALVFVFSKYWAFAAPR